MTDNASSAGGFSSDEGGFSDAVGSEYISNVSSGSADFSAADTFRSSEIRAAASGGTAGLSSLGLSSDGLSQRSYDSHFSSDSDTHRYVPPGGRGGEGGVVWLMLSLMHG